MQWTRDELLQIIRKQLPAVVGLAAEEIGDLTDIEVLEPGISGRNTVLKVSSAKRVMLVRGDAIRGVLRQPNGQWLPSSWFTLSAVRGSSGPLVIAEGRGFGHGLGMCQTGARSRAIRGESYRDILNAYYRDIELKKIF